MFKLSFIVAIVLGLLMGCHPDRDYCAGLFKVARDASDSLQLLKHATTCAYYITK